MTDIKRSASEQRYGLPDEPTCIVCGRYGEYISSITENDVCSLECKKLDSQPRPKQQHSTVMAPEKNKHSKKFQSSIIPHLHVNLTCYMPSAVTVKDTAKEIMLVINDEDMRIVGSVKVSGENIPEPISSLQTCPIPDLLLKNANPNVLYPLSLSELSKMTIPSILVGRNLFVKLSFDKVINHSSALLIPLLTHVWSLSQFFGGKNGPNLLIFGLNSEYCERLESCVKELIKGMPRMQTLCLSAKTPLPCSIHRFVKLNQEKGDGVQICITTPKRWLDFCRKCFSKFQHEPRYDLVFWLGVERLVNHHRLYLRRCVQELQPHSSKQWIFSLENGVNRGVERLFAKIITDPLWIAPEGMLISSLSAVKRYYFIWEQDHLKVKKLLQLLRQKFSPSSSIVAIMLGGGGGGGGGSKDSLLLTTYLSHKINHDLGIETTVLESNTSVDISREKARVFLGSAEMISKMPVNSLNLMVILEPPKSAQAYFNCTPCLVAGEIAEVCFFLDEKIALNLGDTLLLPLFQTLRGLPKHKIAPLPQPLREFLDNNKKKLNQSYKDSFGWKSLLQ